MFSFCSSSSASSSATPTIRMCLFCRRRSSASITLRARAEVGIERSALSTCTIPTRTSVSSSAISAASSARSAHMLHLRANSATSAPENPRVQVSSERAVREPPSTSSCISTSISRSTSSDTSPSLSSAVFSVDMLFTRDSTSSSRGALRRAFVKIVRLARAPGSPTYRRRLPSRPGRSSALSTASMRFVAPKTNTFPRHSAETPSISVSKVASRRLSAPAPPPPPPPVATLRLSGPPPSEPPPPSPRLRPSASISSRKSTQGAAAAAVRNASRIAFSLSPSHRLSRSAPVRATKFTPHSSATARAIIVFPHPGGPCSSAPPSARMP
mmetsp:Transcript_13230/g.30267  ORF Transcript_13230/g.30267 Transcript_13230/m.30267 type:complete len:327 (-) Transcript_13230:50-1030(-)